MGQVVDWAGLSAALLLNLLQHELQPLSKHIRTQRFSLPLHN